MRRVPAWHHARRFARSSGGCCPRRRMFRGACANRRRRIWCTCCFGRSRGGPGTGDRGAEERRGVEVVRLVPAVRQMLADVTLAVLAEEAVDKVAVRVVASRVLTACAARSYLLEQRSVIDGRDDGATHATNVALMTAAMALEARYPEAQCIDVIAAALLHDIGHVLLPRPIQVCRSRYWMRRRRRCFAVTRRRARWRSWLRAVRSCGSRRRSSIIAVSMAAAIRRSRRRMRRTSW